MMYNLLMYKTAIPPRKQRLVRAAVSPIGAAGRGVVGERGLIVSIIATATIDYLAGDDADAEDAAAYFASETYRDHLAWLGLPTDWLPAGIEAAECPCL